MTQAPLPPIDKLHLYLLAGQSNMSGCGTVEDQDRIPHPRILRIDSAGQWEPAVEPLHCGVEARGVGPGSGFARAMVACDASVTIGLVPCGVGGSPLESWEKGQPLYNAALTKTQTAMKDGTLKGILWHQGESNSHDEANARSYGVRLAKMFADLRGDLGVGNVPIVVGTLGDFVVDGEVCPYAHIVNEQIADIPNHVANSCCVFSSGLDAQDAVHFTAEAQRELGRRYAVGMNSLRNRRSS